MIVVPLSSRVRDAPTHVRLRRGEGGAPTRSVLKREQIATLPREFLDPRPLGGALSIRRLAEAEQAVLRALGVPVGY